jgi:hypothetical protein
VNGWSKRFKAIERFAFSPRRCPPLSLLVFGCDEGGGYLTTLQPRKPVPWAFYGYGDGKPKGAIVLERFRDVLAL